MNAAANGIMQASMRRTLYIYVNYFIRNLLRLAQHIFLARTTKASAGIQPKPGKVFIHEPLRYIDKYTYFLKEL